MKRIHILCIAVCALVCNPLSAQYNTNNHIRETTRLNNDGSRSCTNINYYDGLGRLVLNANNGNSASGSYLVSSILLDSKGRTVNEILPVVSSSSGYVDSSALMTEAQTQYADNCPFTIKEYSATDEMVSMTVEGEQWHTLSKKQTQQNIANSSQEVKLYSVAGETLLDEGYYAPNTLVGQYVTDEDGKSMTTFYDLQGKKILERRGDSNDTYYVYNDREELRFVLSPQYQDENDVRKFAYEYQYDAKGRVERKYLPGCDYQQLWYDCMDRVVFLQDARLRGRNLYRYFLYDNLSRVIEQGVCSDRNHSARSFEIRNYYDDYGFLDSISIVSDSLSIDGNSLISPMSLLTGTVMKASDGSLFYTALYYDYKGNITDRKSYSTSGATRAIHTTYSFTDKPVRSDITFDYGMHITGTVQNTYDDNTDRLVSQEFTSSIDGASSASSVCQYSYDDFGRVSMQSLGSNSFPVTFDYDLHGWLKSIQSTAFSEGVQYAMSESGTPCFNGNISVMNWKADDDQWRAYTFAYDDLNRLVSSEYSSNGVGYRYNESIGGYTKNGSVLQLTRRGRRSVSGRFVVVDDISMTYDGNRLQKIEDSAAMVTAQGSFDFKDGCNDNVEYIYDGCGALTVDKNKGIANITYDNLGYPREIQFENGNKTLYVYLPDGTKIKTIHISAIDGIVVPLSNTVELADYQILSRDSVEYFDNIIYENGTIKRYIFDNGYVAFDNSASSAVPSMSYHYYIKDHLGNIRAVVNDNGNVEQTTHYYPSGAIIYDLSTNPSVQPYKYNGKELDRMHGLDWYDYGARNYDAQILTWDRIDPLCEKYYNISPYVYCMNNPVMLIDLYGCTPDSLAAAEMSALAYGPNDKFTNDLAKKGWYECYSYSSDSGFKSTMFRKSLGKNRYEYCLAFAGTDTDKGFIEAAKDCLADISNFLGVGSMQHYESIAAAFGVLSRMDKTSELSFTGHSLGGGLATFASSVTGKDAIIFNAASLSGITGGIASISSFFMGGKIKHYRANSDYVNIGQDVTGRPVRSRTQFINTHKDLSHGINDIIKTFKGKR